MPAVKVYKLGSLKDYVELVQKTQSNTDCELWFRGCGKAGHELLPSLYRHPTKRLPDELGSLERSLVTRFTQRSIPFHSRVLATRWDSLFFMQHYGVPTRLLDWSENPFIAFYFAVMGAARDDAGKYVEDAAVWVLDPKAWNQHTLKDQSYKGGVLSSDDNSLSAYRELHNHNDMPNAPLAMYGSHNSQRIVAQRGVFTVFGKSVTPMETMFKTGKYPPEALAKVVLKSAKIKTLREQILGYGITESVVMPDLDGLAREIRRQFGYGT